MITAKEYAERRQRVMDAVGKDSVVIIPAAEELIRNGDSTFLFRQNADFYYLTGFNEPEAVLMLIPGCAEGEFILFNRERDPKVEVWVGKHAGQEGAVKEFGAHQAFPLRLLDEKIPALLQQHQRIYYPVGKNSHFDQRVMKWVEQIRMHVRAGVNAPTEYVAIEKILHEMRLHKSAAEIELMRHVAKVSADAHLRAMRACRPNMMEYELQAEILAEFSRHGCYPPAYSSIVGGGENGCVLHYINNNTRLNDGDLVLIDAGGEYQNYAADITRTFPVNGRFTAEQRAIYEIVLRAQQAVIDIVKPGTPWHKLQETAVRIITQGLIELEILKGDLEKLVAEKAYFDFYMHNIGHWLGLDTHDAGSYKPNGEWRLLKPGIVLTVEPGIYIRPDEKVAKKWWNIGIRIEDDVLVTESGCEVLTKDVPKELAAIEAIMEK